MTEKLKYSCGPVKLTMQTTPQGGAKVGFHVLNVQDEITVPKNLLRQFATAFDMAANTLRFWALCEDRLAPDSDEGAPIVEHVEAPASVVRDALLLVGIDIPLDRIEERALVARKEALAWATDAHLRAADNKLPELPCPVWVQHWRKR